MPFPDIQPQMAQVFRDKVALFAAALQNEEGAADARQHLRALVQQVLIPEDDGPLKLIGNPEKMLTAASGWNVVAAVGNGGCGGGMPSMPTALYIVAA